MVLSWSRALFLRFYLGQQSENFLRGHEGAFAFFGGVPRVLLYDNLKSAVLERVGEAIRFNPLLLDFADHYRFEPRPVAVARGNEKGRVERAIRYVRSGFFLARTWRDLDDLNAQAEAWCRGASLERRCAEDDTLSVGEALEREREHLLALPDAPFPTDERKEVRVGKTPYVRFDKNDYSVPHTHTRRTLVVLASPDTVRVLDGTDEIARHTRSYDRGAQIEDPAHVAGLVEAKRQGRKHRGMDRLAHAAPATRELLVRLAERGANLGNATQRLLRLLDTYGAEELEAAVREVLERGVLHVPGVRQVLERERRARGLPPATPLALPDDPRVRGLSVRPHSLESYDELARGEERKDDDDDEATPSAALLA
ncbi:MAG: transposase [Alphaproteobacteria bacterium]|nr:MAG: transposase [Alphaproteobacteria bacterium]